MKLSYLFTAVFAITTMAVGVLPSIATAKPITTTDLLKNLRKGEPWDRGVLTVTKTVMFQQAASGGTDATSVSKIRLSYFTSANCTGNVAGSGSYSTPDGTSFPISVGTAFGLAAASTWSVGSTQLSIADMTTIQSVAITLKSTNSNTPQAAFTNGSGDVISYACIPVTCTAGPSGQCTSGSGTQSFTLKTTAAVGDPADGGVIGCQNTGVSYNLFDLVVMTSRPNIGQAWGGLGTTTGATSTTDGAANTATIVVTLGNGSNYAARTCKELLVTGGFTSGWFLPSAAPSNSPISQLYCFYNNQAAIDAGSIAAGGEGFGTTTYWSSTEFDSTRARVLNFNGGILTTNTKDKIRDVRCSRAF